MNAVLRSIASPDLAPETLDTYQPPVANYFGILVMALIGPGNGPGEEVFSVTACSPAWLAEASVTENFKGFEFVRNRLAVARWDPTLIRRAISDLCVRTEGETWLEVATKLSRFMSWEFEDYAAPSS